MGTRGIVICPPFRIGENGRTFMFESMNGAQLREYALYWDLIDLPEQGLVGYTPGPERDIQVLEQEGMFVRSWVPINSAQGGPAIMGLVFIVAQALAAERYNQSGGTWSIGQSSQQLVLPRDHIYQARTVEIELYSAVPVPLGDVPIEDVLEFKAKRRAELEQYRLALDKLYNEIAQSHDIPRARSLAIDTIQRSVVDLTRVMEESRVKRVLRNMKVELSLGGLPQSVMRGAGVSFMFDGVSAPAAIAADFLLSSINLKLGTGSVANHTRHDLSAFAYVYSAQKTFRETAII